MQIVSAYIINFGKLSDTTFNFDVGINQIFERNGYGKTTLMSFIKAMLYGFSTKNKESREFFRPWNNGVYGGTLIIIDNGIEYRIERTFGTTASKDNVKIYNNQTLELLDENEPGIYFLGLDEQSFFYTAYIDENMLNGTANSNLIAKLTQLKEDEQQDLTNYDQAIKKLDEAKKKIKNLRGGTISQLEQQLIETNREIEESLTSQANYDQTVAEIEVLEEKNINNKKMLASFDEQIEKASKGQGSKESRKAFIQISEEQQHLQQEIQQKMLVFPLGLPNDDSIEMCNEKIIQLKRCKQDIANIKSDSTNAEDNDFIKKQEQSYAIIEKQNKLAQNSIKPNKKIHMINTIAGSIILIASVILGIVLNAVIGAILGLLSVVYLVISIINLTKKQPQKQDCSLTDLSSLWHYYFSSLPEFYDFIATKKAENKEKDEQKKLLNKLMQEQDKLQKEITMFFSSFNTTYDSFDFAIQNIKLKTIELKKLDASLAQVTKQLQMFDTSNFSNEDDIDIEKLKTQKNQLFITFENIKHQIASKTSIKDAYLLKAEKYQDLRNKAQQLSEEISILNDKYIKLSLAEKYLTLAKTKLGTKYILPTQEKLNVLAQKFDKTKMLTNIRIKDDLTLVYEEEGSLRSEKSLSSGLRHSLNLLFRFALAQTIFKNDKICLFLDDAFATLDEQNLQSIKVILTDLATKNQVIYFTCSKERLMC